jgi:diguanylate cyclase (GGDEF)-like protein
MGPRPAGPAAAAAYGLPFLIPLVFSPVCLSIVMRLTATLHERSEQLEEEVRLRCKAEARLAILVTTDELTQVPNRRAFFARAAEIANGTGETSTVAILDLDDFKRVNDGLGHAAGDQVLRSCGKILRELPGEWNCVAARLGGEEFGMIVPSRQPEDVLAFFETLRLSFATVGHEITVSIGLAAWGSGENIDAALARADAALYRAKQRGRNRVELASPDDGVFGTDLAPVARR